MLSNSKIVLIVCLLMMLTGTPLAEATSVYLQPSNTNFIQGENFLIDILADIDPGDDIIGFGFDLSATGTGLVSYAGFTRGALFGEDPFYLTPISDSDGINGVTIPNTMGLLDAPSLAGDNILLGSLSLTALLSGDVTFSLFADDLGFSEGLFHFPANYVDMPAVERVTVSIATPVPEPSTFLLFGGGLAGLAFYTRRRRKE